MKKSVFMLVIVSILLLVSCGNEVKNVSPGELSRALNKQRSLSSTTIGNDESYRLWTDGETLRKYVISAESYCDEIGTSGYELIIVYTENEENARAFRYEIQRGHEWAACDPAEKIIFANLGNTVLCVKGNADEADAAFTVYCAAFGRKTCESSEKINKNT